MGWIAGAIALGGAIYGDVSASGSAQQTNDANEQINQANINAAMTRQTQSEGFNAGQQANAQNFSAQQVAQQEAFQQQELSATESYDTTMANTSMQRRVADLKAAGLNPLLAVGQGGASAPTVSTPQGSAAYGTPVSASPAGQGSGIPMQNTGAAFGNLGGQISSAFSAAQTGAQIDLLKAQTDKLNAESGNEIPAQVDYLQSMTGLNNQNAKVASLNAQNIAAKLTYDAGDGGNYALEWTKNWAQTGAATTNTDILRATKDALISAQQSDSTAKALGLQQLRNLNDVQQGNFGKVIAYLNAVLQPASSAAGIVSKIR